MMDAPQRLAEIRKQIDSIDVQLLQIINQRAQLAVEVGNIKRHDNENIFYRPEREAQILQQVVTSNQGPLTEEQVTLIFRNILTSCLSLQHPIKIATLGPEGTFSQAATIKHFGIETEIEFSASIDQVFREIEAKNADYGVVPIENSTTGIINPVLDALRTSALTICGEIILPIHHHLLVASKTEEIRRIYAHEQAFLQCENWLSKNLPDVMRIPVASNGEAAKRARSEADSAAIAGDLAVQQYDLAILEKNIEDNPKNETRFLILGHQKVGPSGKDKTSLLISTPHTPGALIDLLTPFADHQVNIVLIESRPAHDCNWAYFFFIDIEGHQEDAAVKRALSGLAQKSVLLHLLGSYPKAKI
jgi:chorismate mutase/prephenate dehydratase